MRVSKNKNSRGAVRVSVAERVSAANVSSNVFNGSKRSVSVGGVVSS